MPHKAKLSVSILAFLLANSTGGALAAETAAVSSTTNQPNVTAADGATNASEPAPKVMFKPGQELNVAMDTTDIHPTFDVELARKQAEAFPDSAEAAFILAVALTRTSRVEEALNQVKHARHLAANQGGPSYFDKMIAEYEKGLVGSPNDNETRYGLAWAYYMKGYLLGEQSRRYAKFRAQHPELSKQLDMQRAAEAAKAAAAAPTQPKVDVVKALTSGSPAAIVGAAQAVASGAVPLTNLPHIPGALENCEPQDVPAIRKYYELAISKLDDLLKQEPNDVWSIAYRAHLNAEYTGDVQSAIKVWLATKDNYPTNPASYFFLGEAYLKTGNLKEALQYVSKAIALRSLGN